jgi:hypothetical protein
LFRALRLTGLVAITVTFLVFHVALSHLLELDSWAEAANQIAKKLGYVTVSVNGVWIGLLFLASPPPPLRTSA